jgi:diguanylate cyclase (GGDEF)-like protein/PAS domain S-box-containing protein
MPMEPRMTGGDGPNAGAGWLTGGSALAASDSQRALWRMTLQLRYVAIAAAGLLALLPVAGQHHYWVAAITFLVVIPYNAVFAAVLDRTGVLTPVVAYSDQVLAVALMAFAPELSIPLLLIMLAIDATSAVSFGRRVAGQSAIVGALGAGFLMAIHKPTGSTATVLLYVACGTFIILVVGGVSEVERSVRGRYAELMSGIDAVVWEQLTRHPSTLYVNQKAEELFGYTTAAWGQPGFWGRTVHADDRSWATRVYRDSIRRGENAELEYRMLTIDGRTLWVQDRMRVEVDSDGRVVHVRGVLLDITERKRAEEQVSQYVNLVKRIQLALFVFLAEGDELRLTAINPEASLITGTSPDSATGRLLDEVLPIVEADLLRDSLLDTVATGEGFVIEEFRLAPAATGTRVYTAHAFPLPGNAVGLSLQDVTERTMAAEVLRRQALHDGLTGLPNRTLLNDRMRQALQHSQTSGDPVALLLMDLDQFKEVNDALGHDHGDRLLIEMSRRLQRVLRDIDTIARLGGDEFAVLLTINADERGALAVAARVRESLEEPFQLGGISVQTSASIGVALYPDHANDAETLAQRADVAMYTAKRAGGGIALYSPEHDQSSVRRLALLGELRTAIEEDQLLLHYQPTLDLRTGFVRTVEALVRWQHPEHGLMPPAEFIELAEVSGTIQVLTRWVITTAIRQLVEWQKHGLELAVAVNLSVRNLYEPELVPWLAGVLAQFGVDAKSIEFEITESELMDDPLLAMEVLGRLKALGVATSIDDFGTGYSSLSYLKHLPIDQLKIDRSFVGNMVHDESDLTIVRSTIDLSHNLGLVVVAEGVEDPETLQLLAELGCDRAQGFVLSRPVPGASLETWWRDEDRRTELLDGLSVGDRT